MIVEIQATAGAGAVPVIESALDAPPLAPSPASVLAGDPAAGAPEAPGSATLTGFGGPPASVLPEDEAADGVPAAATEPVAAAGVSLPFAPKSGRSPPAEADASVDAVARAAARPAAAASPFAADVAAELAAPWKSAPARAAADADAFATADTSAAASVAPSPWDETSACAAKSDAPLAAELAVITAAASAALV